MTELPWTRIAPGRARRVDAEHVADFFWSVSTQGEPQLLLDFPGSTDIPSLPTLRGLTLAVVPSAQSRLRLTLRLTDNSLRDVFWRLCQDIVEATRAASGEEAAAHVAVRRTWRWHHLLRGGTSNLLSEEEQKGLLGEIHVLRHLLGIMATAVAIESWRGPLGAPKDFEVGLRAIEAKARRGGATPHISISSEDQLDTDGLQSLFLHVIDLSSAPEGEGFTLTDAVGELVDDVRLADEGQLESLEDHLVSAGFDWADDYGTFRWVEGQHRLYEVRPAFPRIQASETPTGVSRVSYEIDLNAIDEYESDWPQADTLFLGAMEAPA